ncbi:MAG: molybdopterin-dependent oxidoreductase, partial [Oscillospiraceae bacterium]|nr:molybdopterin-dependent oxidoreductase [Oscillospiraceae bacterium]
MNELYQKEQYCLAFSAFFESLEKWRGCAGVLGLVSAMDEIEYDTLLRGTDADVYIPLWASAAKGEGKPLVDETTLALIAFCHENGFAPRRVDGNPPDYLGEQFRFLAYLYNAARAEPEAADAAAEFEDRFTVDTVRAFGTALRRYRSGGEAIGVLERMEQFLRGALPAPDEGAVPTPASRRAPPIPTEEKHIVNSAGINNCGGKCKINITVAEGCALEISTDDTDNAPQIRACVRGRGYRHTFLTPHRLRYPMLRIGERGEGKFRRITWDEAARRIAEAALRIGKDHAPEARYFIYATGNCGVMRADHMMKRLLNMDGGYLDAYNSYSSACSTYVEPFIYGDAYGGNSERDVVNSKLLILWGHNPSETIFGSLRNYYLAEAKAKGIPIIVIDPRQSDTALALADEWVPLRPSTDGALADAMAYVIVQKGLHDVDFLHRFCVGFDEQTMPEGAPRGENYLAYLKGELDGVPKAPAWGERITGVSAEKITELAIRYASAKPAAILPGFGPQRHGNGEQGTRALAALACLTGNVGRSGGSAGVPGFCPPRPVIAFPQGEKAFPGRIPTFQWTEAVRRGHIFTARDGLQGVDSLRSDVKLLLNLAGNTLINQHSDINATARLLREKDKCELIVVSDLFMTPSARFADILLPAPSVLESDNVTMPWANDDYLLSNTRAVEPLFGAIPDYEWVRLVARHMGLEEAFT